MDHNVSYEEMIQFTKTFQLKLGVFNLQQKITQQCSDDHFVSFTKLLKDLQSDINGLLLALTKKKLHTKEDVVERRNRNQPSPNVIPDSERLSTMSNQSTDSGRSSSGFRDSGTLSMTDDSIQLPESYAVSNQSVDIPESSLTTTQISEQPSSEKEDSNKSFLLEDENLERWEKNNDELLHKDNKESNLTQSEENDHSDWKARNIEASEHEDSTICRECQKAQRNFKKSSFSESTSEFTVCLICNKSNSPVESDSDSDMTMVSVGIQTKFHIEQCPNDTERDNRLVCESATSEENLALQTPSLEQYQTIHNISDNVDVVFREHQGQERDIENTFDNQNGLSELIGIATEAENETTI